MRSHRRLIRVFWSSLDLYGGLPPGLRRKTFPRRPFIYSRHLELTVLFTALGIVSAMFIRSRFLPRKKFEPIHERITDDRFVILVEADENEDATRSSLKSALSGLPNLEIVS